MSLNLDDDPWVGTKATAPTKPIPSGIMWAVGACGLIAVLAFVAFVYILYRIGEVPETHAVEGD